MFQNDCQHKNFRCNKVQFYKFTNPFIAETLFTLSNLLLLIVKFKSQLMVFIFTTALKKLYFMNGICLNFFLESYDMSL